jgi:hypothetical protein
MLKITWLSGSDQWSLSTWFGKLHLRAAESQPVRHVPTPYNLSIHDLWASTLFPCSPCIFCHPLLCQHVVPYQHPSQGYKGRKVNLGVNRLPHATSRRGKGNHVACFWMWPVLGPSRKPVVVHAWWRRSSCAEGSSWESDVLTSLSSTAPAINIAWTSLWASSQEAGIRHPSHPTLPAPKASLWCSPLLENDWLECRAGYSHRCMAWGVQRGRRQLQVTCPTGGPPLKWLLGRFRGSPPAGSGMAGPGETLGSPWPSIAIRLWSR